MRILPGRILCSVGGGRYRAVLIAAGRSDNGPLYPADMLRRAVAAGVFEGKPCRAFPVVDAAGRAVSIDGKPGLDHIEVDHLSRMAAANTVGVFKETRFDEELQAVVGDLVLLDDSACPLVPLVRRQLQALESQDGLEAVGLSIDGEGDQGRDGSVDLRALNSVDIVSRPAAGGRVLHRIAASVRSSMRLLEILRQRFPRLLEGYAGTDAIAALCKHALARVKESPEAAAEVATATKGDAKRVTEMAPIEFLEAIEGLCQQARASISEEASKAKAADEAKAAEATRATEAAKGKRSADEDARLKELDAKIERMEIAASRARLREACAAARLPSAATAAAVEANGSRLLTDDEIKRVVEGQRKLIDDIVRERTGGEVTILRESEDRMTEAVAHMLNPEQVKCPQEGRQPWMGSIQAMLENFFLGGRRVREALGGIQGRRRLREAVDSTNLAKVFQDALYRATLAAYVGHANFASWRQLVRSVPVNDFRTHHIVNIGYYGTLPTVSKGAPYLALTTPTDREHTIALAKKGGIESIAMEDVLNDDLGLWQQIPKRVGQAAQETAFETVMALIRDATQPTMSDGNTLTSSSRSPANETTDPLTADATGKTKFITAITNMMKQTGGSGQKKGIHPRFCVIPFEKLEAYAYVTKELSGGVTGTDVPDAVARVLKLAIPDAIIDYGTGNATDWYLVADPKEAEVIRFATLGGREEPEIFIADDEPFGALFTHDKLELKVRFIYQAAAVDWAGIQGQDAAS